MPTLKAFTHTSIELSSITVYKLSLALRKVIAKPRELTTVIQNRKEVIRMTWSSWWSYNTTLVSSDRDDFGVYELADDSKNTVYYGSGKVKTRLLDHLNKKECPMAKFYRVEYCSTETECKAKEQQLLEAYKNAHNGKFPMYNERIG